jgi:hypothetical protein
MRARYPETGALAPANPAVGRNSGAAALPAHGSQIKGGKADPMPTGSVTVRTKTKRTAAR